MDGRLHRKYFAVDGSAGGAFWDFLEPGWCIDFGTGHRPPKTPGKSRLHGMPAFPPGCSAAPVCRYFSEVCCFCCWPGCRYIWHIIPESVPMMHRCRRDRSWNIIISIITPLCILCFYRGCCGWKSYLRQCECRNGILYGSTDAAAFGKHGLWNAGTASPENCRRVAAGHSVTGDVFPFHWYMSVSMT